MRLKREKKEEGIALLPQISSRKLERKERRWRRRRGGGRLKEISKTLYNSMGKREGQELDWERKGKGEKEKKRSNSRERGGVCQGAAFLERRKKKKRGKRTHLISFHSPYRK